MLFVSAAFRQWPYLVAAIIDPSASSLFGRNVFAGKFWIDEQIWVAIEFHLHEAAAELGNKREPYPFIGELLGVPPLEADGCKMTILRRHPLDRKKQTYSWD